MAHKILLIDDESSIREMVGIILEAEGFEVAYHDAGTGAVEVFQTTQPDLVLLDVMLPGKDGIEVCGEIRAISGTPIIMLTAKTESDDVVRGLEAGADDYVVKPFDPVVLIARIKARLRPIASASEEKVEIGPLTVDIVGHEVRRGAEKLPLTPLEFNLLLTLALKPKQVFTREMLLETVWGYHYKADTRLVNVHVQRLRSKIEDDPDNPQIVTTVRGIGYKAGQN
ncbi:MtrAB system response regulator MtrA [Rhodoluna sp.]|uniref:MtrAB system response regulator MtrA n=1 Tax=Rhodoluna sp. TaxID=1969481 RepID=UPI0025F2152E|nr:MtrAB system response regulator MtrA [Rhodoluna sp.]